MGQPLGDPLVVQVTDRENRPVPGNEVAFIAPAGAELTPNDTVLTDSDGKATVRYTLATVAGEQVIEARAKPAAPTTALTTSFSQTAESEVATDLIMMGGNGQTAEVRTALRDSLVVRAVDRFGNGVAGIDVTWKAAEGTVSPATVVTGADGRAATQRVLGQRTGAYATTATARLQGSPVVFDATGIAPPSPQLVLVTQPSATASAGTPFDRQPVLQLQDAVGAPLLRADVVVTVQIATGSGSLGGSTTARSNAQGRVSFEDLEVGGRPGKRTLLFAAIDFTPATSAEIDVGPGLPAPGRSSAEVSNGTAGSTTRISVHLEDEFGTPVASASGSVAISIEGANPAVPSVTDEGGGAYSASYIPTRPGTDQIDVRVGGVPVGGSPFASVVAVGPGDPSTTTAAFSRSGLFNTTITVVVSTRDAQGNPLNHGGDQVQVQLNGGGLRNAADRGDGTYIDSFLAGIGPASVAILLNGAPISGSPFHP